jgi:hypothetical protein
MISQLRPGNSHEKEASMKFKAYDIVRLDNLETGLILQAEQGLYLVAIFEHGEVVTEQWFAATSTYGTSKMLNNFDSRAVLLTTIGTLMLTGFEGKVIYE